LKRKGIKNRCAPIYAIAVFYIMNELQHALFHAIFPLLGPFYLKIRFLAGFDNGGVTIWPHYFSMKNPVRTSMKPYQPLFK